MIDLNAQLTHRSYDEVRADYTFPDLEAVVNDEATRPAFLYWWEGLIGETVQQSKYLKDSDVAVHVIAGFGRSALVTRIFIYEETDVEDD